MPVFNLGLQCVALACAKMPEEYEAEVKKCNNLNDIRKITFKMYGIFSAVKDSLSHVKVLLCSVYCLLGYKLKRKIFVFFILLKSVLISQFWSAILSLDKTLEQHQRYVQEEL